MTLNLEWAGGLDDPEPTAERDACSAEFHTLDDAGRVVGEALCFWIEKLDLLPVLDDNPRHLWLIETVDRPGHYIAMGIEDSQDGAKRAADAAGVRFLSGRPELVAA